MLISELTNNANAMQEKFYEMKRLQTGFSQVHCLMTVAKYKTAKLDEKNVDSWLEDPGTIDCLF